jgi:Carboxypeptidase regulatory-like domain
MSVTPMNSFCTHKSARGSQSMRISAAIGALLLALIFGVSPTRAQLTPQQQPPALGSITGNVVDSSGSAIVGAKVTLSLDPPSQKQEVMSGDYGQYSFSAIPPGPFQLTVSAASFATRTFSGTLHPGEVVLLPPIAIAVAPNVTKVVVLPQEEQAKVELKAEEKQRVLGVIPNFYVTYIPNAAPLSPKQKFQLAWKSTLDPVNIVLTAATAGLAQAGDLYSGYGQGAAGYGKRFGAAYGDFLIGTYLGDAVFPSLFKQDPRYFYKGVGSNRSRLGYALANAVICKGDNGHWQMNYSYLLGDLAASGISNAYYPAENRGVGLTLENAAIGVGATAAANVLQEFVIRKFTKNRGDAKSSS